MPPTQNLCWSILFIIYKLYFRFVLGNMNASGPRKVRAAVKWWLQLSIEPVF
ncbi:hypothetical protein BDZ94DRAFT_1247351 [Collybia nuda]|uniref:Uncharacterized protein n=1 Tax=Collybia nuda TaxID=64659 RepID=A0A9P5YFV9_9AGAR|nr:hypothetical protein BDZ94DRAFT_1247351 [Collybia nuda]